MRVPWRAYRRPLWLLHEPAPVRGKLALLSGPERIEAGGAGQFQIARDYYVARDARGVRLWVFRECRASAGSRHAWFMHGVFG